MKTWIWTAIIVLILLLFFAFKMNSNTSANTSEYKTFDCQGFDFVFQFPDFKDWEYKYVEKRSENFCIMYFNWPNYIDYEVPPMIQVYKIKNEQINNNAELSKNTQNISYEYIQDPSLYVDGHRFEEGDWDWLVFYGDNFNVKIERAMFGELPFDADLLYKKIIETFDFK